MTSCKAATKLFCRQAGPQVRQGLHDCISPGRTPGMDWQAYTKASVVLAPQYLPLASFLEGFPVPAGMLRDASLQRIDLPGSRHHVDEHDQVAVDRNLLGAMGGGSRSFRRSIASWPCCKAVYSGARPSNAA